MKVRLEKSFPIPASPQATWELLRDLEATASCMPGAKITERIDDTHYKGTVTVKVGPATLNFRGEIELLALDAAARSIHMKGKGTDASGASAATMELTARVEAADGGNSTLVGAAETTMSGKVAAFGGRVMNSVSDQILEQFAANFAARAATAGVPQAPRELNALALAWAVFRNWLRGLFGR